MHEKLVYSKRILWLYQKSQSGGRAEDAPFFGVSIGLYVMGYVTTGSNKNLLTIVAVLGCLPACKSLVNLILFLKAEGAVKPSER